MRTTLDIPDALMEDLLKATGGRKKTRAVREAIEFYLRAKKIASLKALSGKVRIELDWRKAEKVELKEADRARSHR